MSFSIELKKLTKQFGENTALWQITDRIDEGDRIVVLGHNGAGKSTLLNILATLSKPSGGNLVYSSEGRPLQHKNEIRAHISYLAHESMLYPDLTAIENLRFAARLAGGESGDPYLLDALDQVGMAWAAQRLVRTYSRGMRQRVSLARALLPQPKLLFLDEPFSGLDHEGMHRLTKVFLNQLPTWVMSTHHLKSGYLMANRVWILDRGRLKHSVRKSDLTLDTYLDLCGAAAGLGD